MDYEALRKGKLAIIEPIYGLELPLTVIFSVLIGGEKLSYTQTLFILLIFLGLLAAATRSGFLKLSAHKWERGVRLAILSAIGMAAVNFLTGSASRDTSPLITVWAMNFFITIVSFILLLKRNQIKEIPNNILKKPKVILGQAIFDNLAWLSFAFATTYIAISVATAISESYIALGALMGLLINKEKLQAHQLWGVGVVIAGIIALSLVS